MLTVIGYIISRVSGKIWRKKAHLYDSAWGPLTKPYWKPLRIYRMASPLTISWLVGSESPGRTVV